MAANNWHTISSESSCSVFSVDRKKGLDDSNIQRYRDKNGWNELPAAKKKTALELFLQQFNQPLVIILLAAAVGTAILQEWVDCGVILAVVLVNSITGFIQEKKALQAIAALSNALKSHVTVIRNSEKIRVESRELVTGDIVLLASGDKVPADIRLLSVKNLQIEEASLTGESVPVHKKSDVLLEENAALGDRVNMAYSSTLVTYGQGTGLVVAVGAQTEIGKINQMLAEAKVLETPLTKKVHQLSMLLLYVIMGLAVLTSVAGYLHGQNVNEVFLQAVALAVGAVPEGLPAVITITLAIGVSKLAKKNSIIRKLPAVETLGSTTVICSDKTGTLTQNQMTVTQLWGYTGDVYVSGTGYAPEGTFQKETDWEFDKDACVLWLLKIGALCNEATLKHIDGTWKVEGDPTEGALLASARKAGVCLQLDQAELVDTLPFESEYKYMATLHSMGGQKYILLKGSTESILPKCNSIIKADSGSAALDQELVHKKVTDLAAKGLRVLSFAFKKVDGELTEIDHADLEDMQFVGLQAMIDPPRTEVVGAIKKCQTAGIKVKMITGDHVITARSIAEELGFKELSTGQQEVAIDGVALSKTEDEELPQLAEELAVFARVSPEQKYKLVHALQHQGHIVAMTGDGVNDAPALKQADIGIAMGITGTEVSKDAADMVLADDNFSSIVTAVEEGRGIFDNLIKFITWTLPTNLSEGLVILVAVFLGIQIPISPLQILWINMSTAVLLGMMLAFEKKDKDVMIRQPRKPDAPIINKMMAIRILWVGIALVIGVYFVHDQALARGCSEEAARTASSNMLVFGEMFYLFNCRSLKLPLFKIGAFSNKWVWFGALSMAAIQLAFTYVTPFNFLFKTEAISLVTWGQIGLVSSLILILVELEKWLQIKSSK